ncbi:MAG: aromatic ring-hydroxylating oxygenase subunit alpha [Alphaproteobacteria bacterium]
MPQKTVYSAFEDGSDARTAGRAVLDTDRYTSPDYMAREWERVWSKTWLLAGLESDIREPGDYFLFELGRESVIVVRTEDGGVAALYDACQHRGNKLIVSKHGSVTAFTCPYHGWTYALDGTLKHVPDEERFSQGVPCDELSLTPVKVEIWAGIVWINMDPNAAPLRSFLGTVMDTLEPFHIENMVLVQDQTVMLDANWKTVIDNFNEQYHVDFIHPQHASMVDCCDAENELWPYGHRRVLVEGYVTNPRYGEPEEVPPILDAMIRPLGMDPADFKGRVPEVREAVQKRKRELGDELGFSYAEFTDDQVSDVWQYDLFPNIIATIKAETLWIMRPRPHPTDPNKCFFDKISLEIPSATACDPDRGLSLVGDPNAAVDLEGERPEHELFDQEDVIAGKNSMTITIDQDIHYLRDMQAGMHSAGFKRAWLNDDESRVQHFHDWLDVWMEGNPLAKLRSVA